MDFITYKDFNGKNLKNEIVNVPAYTPLEKRGSFMVYNKAPLFVWNSQNAKDYCIWNGDGDYLKRYSYEKSILFDHRERVWFEEVPIYNNYGEFVENKKIMRVTRFSPKEIDFMRKTWSKFFTDDDVLRFSDYFYVGSSIKEVEELYNYLLN